LLFVDVCVGNGTPRRGAAQEQRVQAESLHWRLAITHTTPTSHTIHQLYMLIYEMNVQ